MPVLYHNTLSGFIEDVESGMIATAIEASGYDMEVGNAPSPGERAAWDKSLGAVKDALKTLPGDLRVYAEYVIPPNSLQRVDFMITGLDAKGKKTAVILELKQWSDGSISLLQDQSEYTVHARSSVSGRHSTPAFAQVVLFRFRRIPHSSSVFRKA